MNTTSRQKGFDIELVSRDVEQITSFLIDHLEASGLHLISIQTSDRLIGEITRQDDQGAPTEADRLKLMDWLRELALPVRWRLGDLCELSKD